MTMIVLSIATFCSTLGGGMVALRFHDRPHYLLSFTAGVLLGVVSFEVIPEIFELSQRHADRVDCAGLDICLRIDPPSRIDRMATVGPIGFSLSP
ncbi:hypothetical protein [Methylibium sp.]|uniref:hypothetical protein n=1 Tax=Methylibium sp. TaxID=2067992 RepID=UPI003D0B45B9